MRSSTNKNNKGFNVDYDLLIPKLNQKILKSNGWGQQAEILTYVVKNSKKIYEIAVNYNGRTYDDGKKIRYYNVFEVIYWMLNAKLKIIFKIVK